MDDLSRAIAAAREEGRLALIGYLALGFPSVENFPATARAALEAGLDVLELGFPTADPFADGAVISAANAAVRGRGLDARSALELARPLAAEGRALVAMMYEDSWLELGGDSAPRLLVEAGFAGIISVGFPESKWRESAAACRRAGLAPIGFVAPDIGDEALLRITAKAGGFVYLQSLSGKTGSAGKFDRKLGERIAKVKAAARGLPVAVGFGVTTPGDVSALRSLGADAAIVGTSIVEASRDPAGLAAYIASLRAATKGTIPGATA
jgi:tryptophan synthase alpha chain